MNPTRTFVRHALLFVGIQATIAITLWLACPVDGGAYLRGSIDKHHALETAEGPRLIVVGGSSAAYGVQAAELAPALGLAPVNMGLMARFGLDYFLNEVSGSLRRGDVVVLAATHRVFWAPPLPGRILINLIYARPANILHVGWGGLKRILDDGLPILKDRARCAWQRGLRRKANYARDSFNECGDFVAHKGKAPAGNANVVTVPKLADIDLEPHIERLQQFQSVARARGARVFFLYPPVNRPSWEAHEPEIRALLERVRRSVDIEFIGDPAEEVYPSSAFQDTTEHLSYEAGLARTRRLETYLRAALRRPAP